MNDLLNVAKELLEDFDLYGSPVQLQVIAKLRRAVEAAQQGVQSDLPNESRECTCGGEDGYHPKSCGLRQSAAGKASR